MLKIFLIRLKYLIFDGNTEIGAYRGIYLNRRQSQILNILSKKTCSSSHVRKVIKDTILYKYHV